MKYFGKTTSFLFLVISTSCSGQFTRQDTLRGSLTPERAWWDVNSYYIHVTPDYATKTISGSVVIHFSKIKDTSTTLLQIDLQSPMLLDSALYYVHDPANRGIRTYDVPLKREGNVYWLDTKAFYNTIGPMYPLVLYFHGKPREAINPPWDGGWIWAKDEKGRAWMTVACQGLGASVWYPCKDYQGDEPDNALLSITVPDSLVAVGNGRLRKKTPHRDGTTTWQWEVTSPINNYNIIPYIGHYVNWTETYAGEKGDLDCSYWVLDYNLEKSKKQFGRDVKPMMQCFEYWFGPYPFYEDSYKLVEAPHLGMEHQSAVAYGNKYTDGYLGMDLSGSGWGAKWDYIIIHETGHEWFGNNITTDDIADMWVHEGFTDYSETLFTECQYGKQAAGEYVQGLRANIQNDAPVIGPYGVNKEGSGDMYYKGANMLHTIRQVINNDTLFRQLLRGLNKDFYHKTVTTGDVERYITEKSGKDLSKIFDQYLRTARVPVLEYKIQGRQVSYRWAGCVPGFNMPVLVSFGNKQQWIYPSGKWRSLRLADWFDGKTFIPDNNFYIITKNTGR